MELPEDQRANLAAELLATLPAVLSDDDEGLDEAIRRSQELDEDPKIGLSWEELKSSLGR